MSVAAANQGPAKQPLGADTLAGGVALLLALTVAQRLIGFGRGVLFCRWLSAEQLGQWDLSFGFLMMAAPVALFGLPGSFGRYVEHFRQRDQLKTFLRRAGVCCGCLAVAAMILAVCARRLFSQLIFGGGDCQSLVVLIAFALMAWIAHSVLSSLFNALRLTRVVSGLQFVNGVAFAVFGVALLMAAPPSTASVITAFGAAGALSAAVGAACLRGVWGQLPEGAAADSHRKFWSKLAPFAVWIWITNWLANLFGLADRYMLIHHSGLPEAEALVLVGQYHSARIVPVLLLGVAELLAALVTPHLTHDWETGRQETVVRRLNLILKGFTFAGVGVGLAVLLVAPWLFGVALGGKYAAGLSVLPWTLAGCVWGSLAIVAANFLWCAEKPRLASLAMLVALAINIGLNLWLLPRYGLLGAALATALANACLLLATYAAANFIGLRPDRGVWLAALLPLALGLGTLGAMAVLGFAVCLAAATPMCLNGDEKRRLVDAARKGWGRVLIFLPPFLRRMLGRSPLCETRASIAASNQQQQSASESGPCLGSAPGVPGFAEASPRPEAPRGWVMKLARIIPRKRRPQLQPPADRGPLRIMFVITCMPVGGAETLLVNLVRRLDRSRFQPELCCLKYFGPLGELLAEEIPAFTGLLHHKYDLRVLPRLTRLLGERRIDAVITVGTGGDKMFWGRLAAWRAGVPVIASALHSTGLPDHVEWMNRQLEPLSDAFIAVAAPHAQYLADCEGCPAAKVRIIPNGVDVERFRPMEASDTLRAELGLPAGAPTAAIVAALRPEKNHELFLQAAAQVREKLPSAQFLIVGDGERRAMLESLAAKLELGNCVHFLGTRSNIPELLSLVDVLVLSSHMEANPVSILEGLACGKPVVATRVGSIPESVREGVNGYLTPPGDAEQLADRLTQLLADRELAAQFGRAGREIVVKQWSLERMVEGYQNLVQDIYSSKCPASLRAVALETQPLISAETR